MAGVTDLPFRKLCRTKGAGLTTSEMLTSDTRLWESGKSANRLTHGEEESPVSVQIAGSEPSMLADAAQQAVARGAQIVDINMGCPAKKVCKKLAGSALLKDEALIANILTSVVQAVDVPVTLKTRTGWDTDNKNGPVVAKLAEDAGVAAIAIHGRTRACKFTGHAEYDTIAKIVDAVSIPVFANGDINSAKQAKAVLDHTQAAAVMIGRAAFGNPWIFEEVNRLLKGQEDAKPLTAEEVINTILTHFDGLYALYGELKGMRIARKHFAWYCQTFNVPKEHIREFNQIEQIHTQNEIVRSSFERRFNHEEKVA